MALLRLLRPLNLLITLVGVVLGAALAAAPAFFIDLSNLLLAAASAVAIAAAGNSFNDVCDYRIDFVNRPGRPIPSGRISIELARTIAIAAASVGLVLAAMVSLIHLTLALTAAVLLYAYSRSLKGIPFIGNAAVAAVTGLVIVYGGWAAGSPGPTIVGAGFAFLTTFAREIVKDIEDLEGDRSVGARTAPVAYGVAASRMVAAGVLIMTVVLTPLPFLVMDYSPLFLLLMLVADMMLLRSIWILPAEPREASRASAWLKGAMVAGIAALFAAVVVT